MQNTKQAIVNSDFGPRMHPTKHTPRPHQGVDVVHGTRAETDGAPIFSTGVGFVLSSGFGTPDSGYDGYGNYVHIQHEDGSSRLYAHMKHKSKVKKGDIVDKYQEIGNVGATGNVSGPHLHYEYRIGNNKIKPNHDEAKSALDGNGHWVTVNGNHIFIKD